MCVQIGNSDVRSFYVIKHSPEAIDTWLKTLVLDAISKNDHLLNAISIRYFTTIYC